MAESSIPKTGLVLSGGGARGAYQAGVIRAIAEISEKNGIQRPLPIVTGVSAGAINAAFLASSLEPLSVASELLVKVWSNIRADQVFKTDLLTAGRSGMRLVLDAAVGALYTKKLARSLLDTEPLWKLLQEKIAFDQIQRNIDSGHLQALGITAMNYSNSVSETFVMAEKNISMWHRARRYGLRTPIQVEHIMASSAIPMFFPPIGVGDHFYGDGCLRNTAPLSPAIHLGADQLLVISVRRPDHLAPPPPTPSAPSIARVLGVILNALMLDSVELDMERMMRVNSTVQHLSQNMQNELKLKKVNWLWLRPSQDIGHLASENFDRLPRVIKYLMSGLGSSREASEITSYLLFDPVFCSQLVELGYQDGLNQESEIISFLTGRQPDMPS
jgi:NTE family protein